MKRKTQAATAQTGGVLVAAGKGTDDVSWA